MDRLSQAPIASPLHDERGQGLVEYAMILLLVVIVAVGAVSLLGTTLQVVYYDRVVAVFTAALGG